MAEEFTQCRGDIPRQREVEEEQHGCMIVDQCDIEVTRSPVIAVSAVDSVLESRSLTDETSDVDNDQLGTEVVQSSSSSSFMQTGSQCEEVVSQSSAEVGAVLGPSSAKLPVACSVADSQASCGTYEDCDLNMDAEKVSVKTSPCNGKANSSDATDSYVVVHQPPATKVELDDVSASCCLATVASAADTVADCCVTTDDVITTCLQSSHITMNSESSETGDVIAHETMTSPLMYSDADSTPPCECTHVVRTTSQDDVMPVNPGRSHNSEGLSQADEAAELCKELSTNNEISYEPASGKDNHTTGGLPAADEVSESTKEHVHDYAMTGYSFPMIKHTPYHLEDATDPLSLSQSRGECPITADLHDYITAADAVSVVTTKPGFNDDSDEGDVFINFQPNDNDGCSGKSLDVDESSACGEEESQDRMMSEDVYAEHSDYEEEKHFSSDNNSDNRLLDTNDTGLDRSCWNSAVRDHCQPFSCEQQCVRSTGACETTAAGVVGRLMAAEDFQTVPCTDYVLSHFFTTHQSDPVSVSQHSQAYSNFTVSQTVLELSNNVKSCKENSHPDDCITSPTLFECEEHTFPEAPASTVSLANSFITSQRVLEPSEHMESESRVNTMEDDDPAKCIISPCTSSPLYYDEHTCDDVPLSQHLTSCLQPSSNATMAQTVVDTPDDMHSESSEKDHPANYIAISSACEDDEHACLQPPACSVSSSDSCFTASQRVAEPLEDVDLESHVSMEDNHLTCSPVCNDQHTCHEAPMCSASSDKQQEADGILDLSVALFDIRNCSKHVPQTNEDVASPTGMDVLASVCESLVNVSVDQSRLGTSVGTVDTGYDNTGHLQEKSVEAVEDDVDAEYCLPSSAMSDDTISTINSAEAGDVKLKRDDDSQPEFYDGFAVFSTAHEQLDQCDSEMYKEYDEAKNSGDEAQDDSDASMDCMTKNNCCLPDSTAANDDDDETDDEGEYETSFEESSADPCETTLETESPSSSCSSSQPSDVNDDTTSDDSSSEGTQCNDDVVAFDDARKFDGMVQPENLDDQQGHVSESIVAAHLAGTVMPGCEMIDHFRPSAEDNYLQSVDEVPDNDSDERKQFKLPEELRMESVHHSTGQSVSHTFDRKLIRLGTVGDCGTEIWWQAGQPQECCVIGENTCQLQVSSEVETDDEDANTSATSSDEEEEDFQDTESGHSTLMYRSVEASKTSSTDEYISHKLVTGKDNHTTEGLSAIEKTSKLLREHTADESIAGYLFPVAQNTTFHPEDVTDRLGLSQSRGECFLTICLQDLITTSHDVSFSGQMNQVTSRSSGDDSEKNLVVVKQGGYVERFGVEDDDGDDGSIRAAEDEAFYTDCALDTHIASKHSEQERIRVMTSLDVDSEPSHRDVELHEQNSSRRHSESLIDDYTGCRNEQVEVPEVECIDLAITVLPAADDACSRAVPVIKDADDDDVNLGDVPCTVSEAAISEIYVLVPVTMNKDGVATNIADVNNTYSPQRRTVDDVQSSKHILVHADASSECPLSVGQLELPLFSPVSTTSDVAHCGHISTVLEQSTGYLPDAGQVRDVGIGSKRALTDVDSISECLFSTVPLQLPVSSPVSTASDRCIQNNLSTFVGRSTGHVPDSEQQIQCDDRTSTHRIVELGGLLSASYVKPDHGNADVESPGLSRDLSDVISESGYNGNHELATVVVTSSVASSNIHGSVVNSDANRTADYCKSDVRRRGQSVTSRVMTSEVGGLQVVSDDVSEMTSDELHLYTDDPHCTPGTH